MRRILIVIVLVLLPALARAQTLEANVIVREDVKFFEKWSENPLAALPDDQVRETPINRRFYFAFAAKGFALDAEEKCRLYADFTLRRPDGKVEMKHENWPKLEVKLLPENRHQWIMLMPGIDLSFEEGDPPGVWLLEATIRDEIGGRSAKLTRELKLIQSERR